MVGLFLMGLFPEREYLPCTAKCPQWIESRLSANRQGRLESRPSAFDPERTFKPNFAFNALWTLRMDRVIAPLCRSCDVAIQSKDCGKCAGPLTQGFLTDQGHGIILVPNWVEGPPQRSKWVGLRLSGRPKSEVSTWRCRRCGYLENYASDEPNLVQEAQTRAQVKVLLIVVLVITAITLTIAAGLLF